MIDARSATGIPCITTCPVIVPRVMFAETGDLSTWQERLLRNAGFLITDE